MSTLIQALITPPMAPLLHESITRQAENRPEAVAVVDGYVRITYGELEQRSNRMARALVNAGCDKGNRVCIAIPKSIDAIVAVAGVLKAGCIYTPLDMSSPPARLARIVKACEPSVVLASESALKTLHSALDLFDREFVIGLVDGEALPDWSGVGSFSAGEIEAQPDSALEVSSRPEDVAYILFTSGSTGQPKGVPISHDNVEAFVAWANRYFAVSTEDRLSGHTALHFDLSVYDLFGTFYAGAELHLVPATASLLPTGIADFIRDSRITQWFSVPSVLNFMFKFGVVERGDFPDLKRVLWCGEVLPTPALVYLMQQLPHVQFTNLYGPTETTIASSYFTVPEAPASANDDVPIGLACDGESLHLLDESLQPVDAGVTADLYIGGIGLSRGYWRDEERTAEAFITPLGDSGHGLPERLYRTGDLAFMDAEGLTHFVGRTDAQIKSRGYRIELGEIEAALAGIDELVESATVAVASDGFEGKVICCAYATQAQNGFGPQEITARLRDQLPEYMIPARWESYDALPRNPAGKIDRVALRERFESQVQSSS